MTGGKRKQLLIRSDAFTGTDGLNWEDMEALRVSSPKDAADKLVESWTGGVVGITMFHLNNDRRKVDNVSFLLLGTLFEDNPKVIATNKIFPNSNAKLVLSDLNCDLFSFSNSLSSKLVDSSALNYSFKASATGPNLNEEEMAARNLGPFSLRAYVYPTTENHMKLDIAIYPLDEASLRETFPMAEDPRLPGIQLCTIGEVRVCPNQEEVLGDRSWGQPTLPAFLSATPFSASSPLPPTSLLRKAFAALMAKALRPTFKKDAKFLKDLWDKVLKEGVSVLSSPPLDLAWPPPAELNAQTGRHSRFLGDNSQLSFSVFLFFASRSFFTAALSLSLTNLRLSVA